MSASYSDQLTALGLSPDMVAAHLTGLSLVRVTNGVPQVLTNEQRAQLLRAVLPSPTYNEPDRPHCQAQRYALDETMDGRYPSTDTYGS